MHSHKISAASLCVFGFEGLTAPDWIKTLVSKHDLAGVILFKRNIESKAQLKELNLELQSFKKGLPLIISVDHEGGRVFRLPEPFTKIPTAREIGHFSPSPQPSPVEGEGGKKIHSPLEGEGQGEGINPYSIGKLMARELCEVGFNLNYAPVLDVDTNPINPIIGDRAFSSDPRTVADCALKMIRGLREGGIIPCGKHFPGHGDTSKDSHFELPQVDQALKRLQTLELLPFAAAIQNKIEMLMTAHVMYPALDSEWPATLSKKIIGDLLRKQMGYEGVLISDDFNMKAIADRWGISEASVRFLEVGGDIVLVCRYEEVCLEVLNRVQAWIDLSVKNSQQGQLSLQRIQKIQKKIADFSQQFSG
ncbi:MAG: glycoside hydrolase family 3 protein [Deltaproteobacteria bacterium]|nr:glycoside hydrolase family 3 protein [Deltaproteobacteria bacterium]